MKLDPPGPSGSKCNVGERGGKGDKGDAGGIGPQGFVGPRGSTALRGVRGVEGVRGVACPDGLRGPDGIKGDRGPQGSVANQGFVGDQGERGERGEREEKCLQGDTSDALSVLADHLPIQLGKRYCEKLFFVKYHVSEDKSSIVESSGGVQTLRNVSAYNEPTWHFDAKFVDKQGHTRANV